VLGEFDPIPPVRERTGPPQGSRADFLKLVPNYVQDGFDLAGKVYEDRLHLAFGRWDVEVGDDDDLRALESLHRRSIDEYRALAGTLQSVYSDPDPTLNSAGRLKIAGSTIEPRIQALATVAERELARADERIEAEEKAIAAVYKATDSTQAVLHGEIRRHVADKGLNRLALARGELDDATLQAIASGPAYLSGLDADTYQRVRQLLAERAAPERVQKINRLRQGKQRAVRALDALDRKSRMFVDFDKARALSGKGRP